MIFCDKCICHNCGCEFYYPTDYGKNNATDDYTIICPKCGSENCGKK